VKIIWAEAAVADLVAIRQFIAAQNSQAANTVAARILHAIGLLKGRPHLGLNTHRQDVRRLVVSHSPYSIIYRVAGTDLQILES
jgi:toxin ParE1/3/4